MGRRWSDDELAVALDSSVSVEQVAQQLGRTVGAVRSARAMYPRGRVERPEGRKLRWSPDDIAVLLDESLTVAQVSQRLGRAVGAVYAARRRYGKAVPEGTHGTMFAWRFHGCKCQDCLAFGKRHYANTADPDVSARRVRRLKDRHAELTAPGAYRGGEKWSAEHIEIACDRSLAVVDAARMLGRTAMAVTRVRARYNPDGSRKVDW
ncbi:hypothetical protein [Mycobacteroides abscessus]|uniref:hypothetical protein n=1 Tax=Mycobacteroides abscessus TaxID=36809 RepID=UPI000C2653ED|nr:hypothetical protein [Mycobacteroides abscessus]RIS62537.1 hypothetical protein D2E43_06300 [Mycobacteroides abscessus]